MTSISEGRVEVEAELRGRGREESTSVMSVTSLISGNSVLSFPVSTKRSEHGLGVVLSLNSMSKSLTSVMKKLIKATTFDVRNS